MKSALAVSLFCCLSAVMAGCGTQLDLMVVSYYPFPVKILSQNKSWEMMQVPSRGASWERNIVPDIGPTAPFFLVIEDLNGKEIERRQVTKAEADSNLYHNRL